MVFNSTSFRVSKRGAVSADKRFILHGGAVKLGRF